LNENFNKLFKNFKNKNLYLERIKYEIKIIEKLKFEDYFLII
jgi:DNA polymerase III alpha subunit